MRARAPSGIFFLGLSHLQLLARKRCRSMIERSTVTPSHSCWTNNRLLVAFDFTALICLPRKTDGDLQYMTIHRRAARATDCLPYPPPPSKPKQANPKLESSWRETSAWARIEVCLPSKCCDTFMKQKIHTGDSLDLVFVLRN